MLESLQLLSMCYVGFKVYGKLIIHLFGHMDPERVGVQGQGLPFANLSLNRAGGNQR